MARLTADSVLTGARRIVRTAELGWIPIASRSWTSPMTSRRTRSAPSQPP